MSMKTHPKKNNKVKSKKIVKRAAPVRKVKTIRSRSKRNRTRTVKRPAKAAAIRTKAVKRKAKVVKTAKLVKTNKVGDAEALQIKEVMGKQSFADFISRNVGKRAMDVIKVIHTPQTDEKVAVDLNIKINEVRRMLNVLDSYGVAKYDTNKDSKGWLTFEWYLNVEKLLELDATISNKKPEAGYKLQEDCNDFFFCSKCYDEQKVILPFDAAFEREFKCDNCGGKLKLLNRKEAAMLFEQESSSAQ